MKLGLEITLAGKQYVAPELPLKAVKVLLPKVQTHQQRAMENKADTMEAIELATEIVLASLRVNYPDLTAQQLEDDGITFNEITQASIGVLTYSGFVPGKAMAMSQEETTSTGTGSTAS